ncbi:histone deacetylase family protein [Marinimicrobium agarilyticum]|uniref:histone deacetylase family protein n=1 Tax=Marinimicrobium agarilyticum TaxID=306546 RepID=UPI0003FD3C5A|nr:histone deacetylase family protein [Marinimicrobium agarilyticum]
MLATIISHPSCHQHRMPEGHPECPERLDAINNRLLTSGVDGLVMHRQAPAVTREQLLRVHEADYLDSLEQASPSEGIVAFDTDVYLSPGTLEAARHAAGAAAHGVDLVMAGETDAVFCNVRPPGHHAEPDRAMGFCLYNNVAIAATHALEHHGLERVAIVDFDVHHGNGTQTMFYDEPRVLFCSSFQHPFYPGTPVDVNVEHIVNVPLPATCTSDEFRAAISERWLPALAEFKPQLLLISAGFDAHEEDDMSSIGLTDRDYQWVSEQLRTLVDDSREGADASQHCRGIVSTLEGGYNLSALGRSAVAHIKALAKL